MSTAVTASEREPFVPESLKDVAVPPSFTLRPATGRSLRQYKHAIRSEGLTYHSPAAFRAETLRALEQLWTPADFAIHSARLNMLWIALDQGADFDPAEKASLDELHSRLADAWQPLCRMSADNIRFAEDSMKIAASMVIAGWDDVDLPFRREAGLIPLDLIDEIEDRLRKMEEQAVAKRIEGVGAPGTAFLQLLNACSRRLNLGGDEEKNSPSPSPASSDLSGSETTSSVQTEDVSSQASANSMETPLT